MVDKIWRNQPRLSVVEWIVGFIAANIPLYVGEGIAEHFFGVPHWAAFIVGLILMAACMLTYLAIRGLVLSE